MTSNITIIPTRIQAKQADFAILESDPLETDPSDIDKIGIAATWLDGIHAPGTDL